MTVGGQRGNGKGRGSKRGVGSPKPKKILAYNVGTERGTLTGPGGNTPIKGRDRLYENLKGFFRGKNSQKHPLERGEGPLSARAF